MMMNLTFLYFMIPVYLVLFWLIMGSPSPKPILGFFSKKWKYPAGKYNCIGYGPGEKAMYSLKGETVDEMFVRRDGILKDRIRDSHPWMDVDEYLAIPTDKTEDRYRMRLGKIEEWGATGAILERKTDGNILLTLYNLKIK
jgi:hypothetical protein